MRTLEHSLDTYLTQLDETLTHRDARGILGRSSYLVKIKNTSLPLLTNTHTRTGTPFPGGIPTPFNAPPLIAQKSRALRRIVHRSQRLPTAESYSIRAPHPGSVHTLAPPLIPPRGGAFEGTTTSGPGGQSTSIRYPWHADTSSPECQFRGGGLSQSSLSRIHGAMAPKLTFQPFPLAPFLVVARADGGRPTR